MRRPGFTLIELMIVIGLISILAAIMLPNFLHARSNALLTTCESNEKNMATGLEMYGVDNQGHFPTTLFGLTPNYLKVIPTCPSISSDTYTGGYTSTSSPDGYTFVCSGNNHLTSFLSANFPQYASSQGLIVK